MIEIFSEQPISKKTEWENEEIWMEIERLYPPEGSTKIDGANELIKGVNFSGKKVLDDGCGTGWFGKILQDKGADVVGTDISDTLLKVASKSIPAIKADANNLPFKDESFDYVTSFMVLHIFDDPTKPLKEIHRVLKPNGKSYIGIVHPNSEKWDEQTGLCYFDPSSFDKTEERPWVFNLNDGRRLTKHYIHKPMSFYESEINKLLTITRKLEPKFPQEMRGDSKYASTEYLFFELTKNKPMPMVNMPTKV